MQTRELAAVTARRAAVPVLQQLWPESTDDEILDWTGRDDYTLLARCHEGKPVDPESVVGVAGVLVPDVLHHERHAWLYDLVVDEAHRGEGHGEALLTAVEEWAREHDCERVALASPIDGEDVHAFYEHLGYERWGYVIEREL